MSKRRQETKVVTHKEDPILTMSEVARMIGKTPTTVRSYVDDGLFPAVRFSPNGKPPKILGIRKSVVDDILKVTTFTRSIES